MDNKELLVNKITNEITNNITNNITNEITNEENDENEDDEVEGLPDYEDDEDFRIQMNEAIMRNMAKLEQDTNVISKNIKIKKTKERKVSNNISLGSFMKVVDDEKPKVFVSKRKQDKIGQQYKRIFNPRKPPYLLVKVNKKESVLNENDFPTL